MVVKYGALLWNKTLKNKHPIQNLHTEICKIILKVHRNIPNDGCRAELGKFPLIIRIQKRAIKFYQHLKASKPSSYHYKALQCQEESKEGSPLSQLVHRLSSNSTGHQDRPHTIQPNQIIAKEKDNYINYWTSTTKTQSKLQCYLALNRQYSMGSELCNWPKTEENIDYAQTQRPQPGLRERQTQTDVAAQRQAAVSASSTQTGWDRAVLHAALWHMHRHQNPAPHQNDMFNPKLPQSLRPIKTTPLTGRTKCHCCRCGKMGECLSQEKRKAAQQNLTWSPPHEPAAPDCVHTCSYSQSPQEQLLLLLLLLLLFCCPVCFGNIVNHSHANKACWNWNWKERNWERERERERERELKISLQWAYSFLSYSQ